MIQQEKGGSGDSACKEGINLIQHPASSDISLRDYIEDVPDFPSQGIVFRDIAPLLRNHFAETIQQLSALLTDDEWQQLDMIGGVESRGFILAAGLAAVKNKGFVKIRKAGKLPGRIAQQHYGLEYGQDTLEMQYGTGKMLIVDDVLATGGTLSAAADLAAATGHEVLHIVCLINLTYLNQFSWQGKSARTLIDYA